MDADRFEALVDEAVANLPPQFAARLDNVDVVVERKPALDLLRKTGLLGRGTLLGLYRGVPQTKRTQHYGAVLPDQIVIYREPVLAEAGKRRRTGQALGQVVHEVVRRTVLHEIGHHFGLSEADLRKYDG